MKNLLLISMLAFSINAFSLNYTISFTGSGASTKIDNVVVQNLTKNTTVTVPSGNTLNLVSSITTTVENSKANNANIKISTNAFTGKSTLSFLVKNRCATQLNVFSIDGRKVISHNQNLQEGLNSFELFLPQGIFLAQVEGYNFSFTGKIISQSEQSTNPTISLVASTNQETAKPQKAKSETAGITQMEYTSGDQLLYKAASSIYSTIITDIPSASKTTNFVFYECSDANGNNYSTVTIGTQVWMAENLSTTKYKDNTNISYSASASTAAYCDYNNNASNSATYGRLYNWSAVNTGKLAPTGWHVASYTEWISLSAYLGNSAAGDGGKMKETGIAHWTTPNSGATNESGFTALPGGYNYLGSFYNLGNNGCWWTATENDFSMANSRNLDYNSNSGPIGLAAKAFGYSVRCIKD